jgi:Fusaric acid resistance protein family
MSLVFRTIDPSWNALRISKSGYRAVSRLATENNIDLAAWTIQMFDRLGLVTSRINAAGNARLALKDVDGLRDLRVGLNIGTIRGLGHEFGSASRAALQGVLKTVSGAYSDGPGDRRGRTGIDEAIDRAITSLKTEAPSRAMREGLAALIGLRLDLATVGTQYAIPHTL